MSESEEHKAVKSAQELGEKIQKTYPEFPLESFVAQRAAGVRIAEVLRNHLPPDYPTAVEILISSLGPEYPGEEGMFKNHWKVEPFLEFVLKYGSDDFDASMRALYEITKRYSSRNVLREFLMRYPERTMGLVREWVQDESPHVRRLVSDATRPRLPTRKALSAFIEDPRPLLDLLECLKNDPSPIVRKSVAASLGDVLKDNPDIAYETLSRWQKDASKETSQVIRHALRYQIKKGDPRALDLLGYAHPEVTLHGLKLEPETVQLGDALTFSFALQSKTRAAQKLNVDYIIHYVTATGKMGPAHVKS